MGKRIAVKRPKKRSSKRPSASTVLRVTQEAEGQAWRQMFVIAEQWKSDIEFFKEEIEFLKGLVNEHYATFVGAENIEKTRSLTSILNESGKRNEILMQDIQAHMSRLAGLFENPFAHDAQECKDQHENLEKRLASFTKDFRSVKMEAFALSKVVLMSERAAHLLKP